MNLTKLAFVAAILSSSTPVALATTFTVNPTASLDLSGNVNATFVFQGLGTISGSGTVAQQGPGSLHTNLGGTLVADGNGTALNFPGGSNVIAQPSGSWNPQKAPAAFGFDLGIPLLTTGPTPASAGTLRLIGDLRDVSFDLTGSVPLTGPAGNQTFDTNGLAVISKSGTLDLQGFFCAPGVSDLSQCMDLGTKSSPPDDISTPDILPHGPGTLTGASFARTLALPISITTSDSQTQTQTVDVGGNQVNVTVTFDGTFILAGNLIASAIPEPASWLALCIGLPGLAFALSRKRRDGF